MTRSLIDSALAALLLLTPALRGDVTIHYENTFKLPAGMPGLPAGAASALPPSQSVTMRVKGNKGFSDSGKTVFLEDFTKQEITIIDKDGKKFATMPMKDYLSQIAGAVPKLPEAATQIMESVKVESSSKITGNTEVIHGVQAEETEITFTVSLPGLLAGSNSLPPGPMMRFVMHLWTAKADEAFHNDAIRQIIGHNMYVRQTMNPLASMQKLFGSLPGMSKSLAAFDQPALTNGVVLRSHGEMFMPMMAMLAKMSNNGQGAPMDPDSPIMEMNSEVTELSTAPVDDSVFQIPATYVAAPVAEMVHAMLPSSPSAIVGKP